MRISITIDCVNAAFDDLDGETEVIRILRELLVRIGENGLPTNDCIWLNDTNGNRVGTFQSFKGE